MGSIKSKVNCFYSICESLIKKFGNPLTADFAYTYISNYAPDGDDLFMWIANAKHEIGVQPVHYEIRVDGGKIFVEVHVESENPKEKNIVDPNEKVSVVKKLTDVLDELRDSSPKKLKILENITSSSFSKIDYHWYRRINSIGFNIDDSEKNVEEIFKELQELDKIVGEKIRDVIEK